MTRYDRIIAQSQQVILSGYMPVSQVAIKNQVPLSTIHRLIHARAIPYKKIGGFYFVRADLVIFPTFREWDDRTFWQVADKGRKVV
jgi:hypothetical protein